VYRKAQLAPSSPSDFELPSCGRLSPDNRWVKMAQIIPWSEFEAEYAKNFPTEMGAPAKSFRMAFCVPADITYPTDLGLLNKARVHTEKIIDILYKQIKGQTHKKPRTYRNIARKDYLAVAKQRRPTKNKRRQAIKKQLQYIKRNLAHIEQLIELGASLEGLTKKQYKTLLVLTEVTRQQQWLFDNDKQSIEDRIVSLSQPHIRPIVRGKAGKSVEFGAKLSASCFEGYVFLEM
jgi:transposase, IS5 family